MALLYGTGALTWNSHVIARAVGVDKPTGRGASVQGEGVDDSGTHLVLDAAVAGGPSNAGRVAEGDKSGYC